MRKHTAGMAAVPAAKRDAANKICEAAGLGPDFFSVLIKDGGNGLLYAASASLSESQWAIVSQAIESVTTKENAKTAIAKSKAGDLPTKASFTAEMAVQLDREKKNQVKQQEPKAK